MRWIMEQEIEKEQRVYIVTRAPVADGVTGLVWWVVGESGHRRRWSEEENFEEQSGARWDKRKLKFVLEKSLGGVHVVQQNI